MKKPGQSAPRQGIDPAYRNERAARARLADLETLLAPREFIDRIAVERASGNELLAQTLESSDTARRLRDEAALQPFTTEPLSEDALLCRGRPEPQGRCLLVFFTGRKYRPMMPLPLFLQDVDAADWDVLVLADRSSTQFRQGCRGLGDDFVTLAHNLAARAAEYRFAASIGASLGGFAAVRLALATGKFRGISVGGRFFADAGGLVRGVNCPPAFDPICACLGATPRDAIFVHGAGHDLDSATAELAAKLTGGLLLPFPGRDEHSLLWVMKKSGRLAQFLRGILDPAAGRAELLGLAPERARGRRRRWWLWRGPVRLLRRLVSRLLGKAPRA